MPKGEPSFRRFSFGADDPLADEHRGVSRWIEEAQASLGRADWYREVELKSLPCGRAILKAEPDRARRYLVAAVAQARHWDAETERVRSGARNEMERMNAHHLPGWGSARGRWLRAKEVISALMRRSLPLEEEDLVSILAWCCAPENMLNLAPVGSIARALERHAGTHDVAPRLLESMRRFASLLRASHDKAVNRTGTMIEQLCARGRAPELSAETPADRRPVQAAAAGNPAILQNLKRHLGLTGDMTAAEEIGPDRFPLHDGSPLVAEHALLTRLLEEAVAAPDYSPDPGRLRAWKGILALDEAGRGRALLAAAERATAAILIPGVAVDDPSCLTSWKAWSVACDIVPRVVREPFRLDRQGIFDLILFLGTVPRHAAPQLGNALPRLLASVEEQVSAGPLTEGERYALHLLRASLIGGPPLGAPGSDVERLNRWIADGSRFYLVPGEAWSDAVNRDLGLLPAARRERWVGLLRHLLTATAARPSEKWLGSAAELVEGIGSPVVRESLVGWLGLLGEDRSTGRIDANPRGMIHEENATCLRGMLWITPTLDPDRELARLVASVAVSAYRKVPGVGPRAVKVGNAAVYALSRMPAEEAVGHLARLKVRVKFGTAQKEIEKAFTAASEALGLPRDEIEEMAVPTYGLEEVGRHREKFGVEFHADLRVEGREVSISWFRGEGKPLKSVPARVKSEFKEELKELQASARDIAAMLPAQAERIDSLFLAQARWPLAAWTERYLDHPLVGTIARRLVWSFHTEGRERAGIWLGARLVDVEDRPLDLPAETEVGLWHPLGRPLDDVLAWREWLQRHEVRQPFKQAHREVYLLTEAERRTGAYSNRFAAHVLRQHQFNALCAARGWRNKLRLMVDDTYPPASRPLPRWGLRAEFWIEGIGDEYGVDTNDSGVFLRVATDQVRFYRLQAAENRAQAGAGAYESCAGGPGAGGINEPIPIEEVPALVFSEVMRDVDLFVGVASVGNDPTWQDGGPGGRYLGYWQAYSFGELTETAKTRKQVLERLVPRTRIAGRCSLSDKFLVVRGDLRTYKIHLGSGNILMEPNDQYLCIVPARNGPAGAERVFLPFEGDTTLSVILSKAFLLSQDRKISDPTIVRQIVER